MLAALLVHANQVVSTHRLIDELWGEAPPPTARNVLQCHVSRLRRALHHSHDRGAPTQILSTQQHGYLLRVEPGQLDLHRFEELLAQARSASAEQDYEQAADRLRGALARWRAGAGRRRLGDLSWTVGARLEEARLVALEERVEADLALGRHAEVVGEPEALVASHPARERPRRQLMLALYRSGRPAEALGVYRSTRQVLVEEFGLEPSPALQQLERAILLADPALEPARPGAGHRRRPPPSKGPCQLPPDLLDFTGRGQMVRALTDCLAGAGARLPGRSGPRAVAISGPAGTGKTALVLHVAHRLRRSYPDGQLWADLRGLEEEPADPPGVLAQFLRALDPDTSSPGDLGEWVSQYRVLLADRRVLVVLDNAASETQVRPLLPAGGRCGVLVTGRRRLSVLEGATLFDLGVFSPAESLELLGRIVGTTGWPTPGTPPSASPRCAASCPWRSGSRGRVCVPAPT